MYEPSLQSEFSIEEILNDKIVDGKLLYLVKWKGYSRKQSSWQPEEHLKNAPDHVALWKEKKKKLQKVDKVSKRKKAPEEQFNGQKYIKKNNKSPNVQKREIPKRKNKKNVSQLQLNIVNRSTSEDESNKSCNSETTSYRGKGLKKKQVNSKDPIESILESIKKLKERKSNLTQNNIPDIPKVPNQLPIKTNAKKSSKKPTQRKKKCQQQENSLSKQCHKKINAPQKLTKPKDHEQQTTNLSKKTQTSTPDKVQNQNLAEHQKKKAKPQIIPSQNQDKQVSSEMFSIRKKDLIAIIQSSIPEPQNTTQVPAEKPENLIPIALPKGLQEKLSSFQTQQPNPNPTPKPQKSFADNVDSILKTQVQNKPVITSFANTSRDFMNFSMDDDMYRKMTKYKYNYGMMKRQLMYQPRESYANHSFDGKDHYLVGGNTSKELRHSKIVQQKANEVEIEKKNPTQTVYQQKIPQKVQQNKSGKIPEKISQKILEKIPQKLFEKLPQKKESNNTDNIRPAIYDEVEKQTQKEKTLQSNRYKEDQREYHRDISQQYNRNDSRQRSQLRDYSKDRHRDSKDRYRDYSKDRVRDYSANRDRSRDGQIDKRKKDKKEKKKKDKLRDKKKNKDEKHKKKRRYSRSRSSSIEKNERRHKKKKKYSESSSSSSFQSSSRSVSPQFSTQNDNDSSFIKDQKPDKKRKNNDLEQSRVSPYNDKRKSQNFTSHKKKYPQYKDLNKSQNLNKSYDLKPKDKHLRTQSVIDIAQSSQNNSSSLAIIDEEQFTNRTHKRVALNEDYDKRYKANYNYQTKTSSSFNKPQRSSERYDPVFIKEIQNALINAKSLINFLDDHPTKWWKNDMKKEIKQIKRQVKEDFRKQDSLQRKNMKKNQSFNSSFNESEDNWNFPFQTNHSSIKLQSNNKKPQHSHSKSAKQSSKASEQNFSSTKSTHEQKSKQSDTECFNLLVADILEWFKDVYPQDEITTEIRKEIEEVVHQMVDENMGDDLVEKWMDNYGQRKEKQKQKANQKMTNFAQKPQNNPQEVNKKTQSLELDKSKISSDQGAKSLDYISSYFKPKNKKAMENAIKIESDIMQNKSPSLLDNRQDASNMIPKSISQNASSLVKYQASGSQSHQNNSSTLNQDPQKQINNDFSPVKDLNNKSNKPQQHENRQMTNTTPSKNQQKSQQQAQSIKSKNVVQTTNIIKVLSEFQYKGQKCFKILLNSGKQVNAHEADVKKNCAKLLFEYYERKVEALQNQRRNQRGR